MEKKNQQNHQSTKLSQKLKIKVAYIYQKLVKLGCILLKSVGRDNIEQTMDVFFQATDSRLELIEWVVATIIPEYCQDPSYKNSYDDDPHIHYLKKLSISLWQLGVMPYNKFTKNLAYHKYIEGLLGHEAAVSLIYDLVVLADTKYSSPSKQLDEVAGELIEDLTVNFMELVNPEYDPYGVTFPPKFFIGRSAEEEGKSIENMYNQIMLQLQAWKSSHLHQNQKPQQNGNEQEIFAQMQTYKLNFQRKYEKFAQKIGSLTEQMNNLGISPNIINNRQMDVQALHERRMLNVSKDLCQQYRTYRKLISSIKQQSSSEDVSQAYEDLINQIRKLNEVIPQNL